MFGTLKEGCGPWKYLITKDLDGLSSQEFEFLCSFDFTLAWTLSFSTSQRGTHT